MTPIVFSTSDPLRLAAESFVARLRRGERPTLAEYAERLPDQAARIREIFPRLLAAERRHSDDEATGPFGAIDGHQHCPTKIGDYVIVREIGRGGMGIVYEAMQASLGRQVALKVLPIGPCSRGPFLERFRREARAAARLHHTNIVPVFGTGEADGVHYYAMQFIEGMGLDAVLKEFRRRRGLAPSELVGNTKTVNIKTRDESGRIHIEDFELGPASILPTLQPDEESTEGIPAPKQSLVELAELAGPKYYRSIARLGVQAAEAVAYAHIQGILHRDIKPSNFLLDRHGVLWITDFGLAKADGEDMTGTGDIVGTLRYMAPERFQAKSDARSDVYALGMTLYELIALRPAFEEDDRLKLVDRINRERPARLRNFDPEVPRDLETIILKAIQKSPDHRYPSAVEMADDLRRFLTDRAIKARRATLFEELRRWCRRNPAITGLIGLVLLTWFLLVGVVVYANIQLRKERDEVVNQSKREVSALKFADDRRWHAEVTTAQLRRSLRQPGQRFEALDALADAHRIRPDPILTSHAIASLALPDIRRTHTWEGWPSGTTAIDFDANLERYARADREGRVSIRAVAGDIELLWLPGLGGPAVPRFSRNDRFLAVWHERDGQLRVWRFASDLPASVLNEPANTICFDFSANDEFLVSGHMDGRMAIHRLTDGKTTQTLEFESAPTGVSFHPKDPLIAVAIGNEILFIDANSGEQLNRSPAPTIINHLTWHPDGQRIAATTTDGQVLVYRRPGEIHSITVAGHRGGTSEICFHPDGTTLVSAGADNLMRFWDAMNGRLLLTAPSRMTSLRFNRDGRRLAADLDGVRTSVLEIATGREYRTLTRRQAKPQTVFYDGAVSLDGHWLAMAATDGVVLWNLMTGEELGTLPLGHTVGCVFSNNQELVTSGANGVFAWAIRPGSASGIYEIGPPRQIATGPTERIARSRNGATMAVAVKAQGALVLDSNRPTIRTALLTHEAATFLSVSPDGSRIATGTQDGRLVRIWDAQSSRLVKELPIMAGSDVVFSPDGRWLATNSERGGVQLWSATNWQAGPTFPGSKLSRVAFSPDGRLVVVDSGSGAIKLYSADKGELVTEFEDPSHDRAHWLAFSPDGCQLIAACNDSTSVHIWEIAAIHDGLAIRGLDRPLPSFVRNLTKADAETFAVIGASLIDPITQLRWIIGLTSLQLFSRPTDAEVYCRRGTALSELGLSALAVQDFTTALRIRPDHAEALYLRGSELFRMRQWEPALDDFTQAQDRLANDRPGLADLARWMRGKALLQLDRVEEMMNEVNGLLGHYPTDPQLYYQRAFGHAYRGRHSSAVSDLHLALKFGPTYDPALNNLAWILVTGPSELRDHERGVGYAQRAVALAPHKSTYQNTLGVGLYRLGRYREALNAFEKSLANGLGQHDGYDLYLKSMCLAQLNEFQQACECYSLAWAWQQKTRLNAHESMELEQFRKEAEAVIAIGPPEQGPSE